MDKYDRDEQEIHQLLSQITVDSSQLAEQVKDRLQEEKEVVGMRRQRWWTRPALVGGLMSVLLIAGTAAALGNFDWFMQRFNPSFGEIVESVEAYSEDEGIRMEVIGAQKYDNRAIVYLSLQDLTGKNRLTEQTDFREGFGVKVNPQRVNGQQEVATGFSYSQNVIFFDEDTNTIYYEFNITADATAPMQDPLELGSFLIYFDGRDYMEEPISVTLSEVEKANIVPIKEAQIWGGSNLGDDWSFVTKVLNPGNYAAMPHGEQDQWVSNIGKSDGKLHVQIGKIYNQEFGSTDANLSLKGPNGQLIPPEYSVVLLGDDEGNFVDIQKGDYSDARYKYEEFIFPVDTKDLSEYTLLYTGAVYSGVKGKWKVAAHVNDPSRLRTWKNDIPVEGHLFEMITLSPLGVEIIGTYQGDHFVFSDMSLEVEMVDELLIPLKGGGGSEDSNKQTFHASWSTSEPLAVEQVTAILINGVRIPVQ
ncbi:hypothetical protein BEP19_09335 [Ammoniphilus oxalaticus]|uniref:DUF4179 domain-containing protein n=1 Tax=Ammoniphilus oxalaticus TaxID=66863 RepID=A0A419SKN3_9BACL|nr:hypothetical protein [Ammoniphilus oxalaticus]RKD24571.1 hypothetical protein BEP19_09335 [Ammoniphilus oxalaticus]